MASTPIHSDDFVETYHNETYPARHEMQSRFSCKGKTAFITDGGGIGKATTLSFARAGARAVLIASRTECSLATTKKEIQVQYKDTVVK
jgi:NADP-dependent 3-hydroxy acid dehydrogenase YdfG